MFKKKLSRFFRERKVKKIKINFLQQFLKILKKYICTYNIKTEFDEYIFTKIIITIY